MPAASKNASRSRGRGESRHLLQVELELPDVGQESCVVGFVSIHEKGAPVNALGLAIRN